MTSTGPGSSSAPASPSGSADPRAPAKPGPNALTAAMAPTSLSAEDVQDILRLLDTFAPPTAPPPPTEPAPPTAAAAATGPAGAPASVAASQPAGAVARGTGTEAETGRDVREVRAPLLGTFYRAPQPGAPPYVEIGSQVAADTVVAIIETMKLMNPVYAGTAGTVSEICLDDGQFAEQDAVLMRVSARAG